MKKKISFAVIVVTLLIIATMGAAAAAVSGWDVLQFLFAGRNQESPDMEYTVVSREAETAGAYLRVESAIYDGRMLAFDYSLENKKPDAPMYCRVEDFTANGVRIWTDGVDDFHEQWIPGLFSDGSWQDGELILLPETVRGAERLRIDLTVALCRPVRPVYRMEEFDAAEAQAKAEEGYYVIAGGEGFVGYDEEEGRWTQWFMGAPPDGMGEYQTETLRIAFDLSKPEHGFQALKTQPSYENEHGSAVYETAEITPLGLYLTLKLSPGDGAVWASGCRVLLTDGQGNSLEEQDREKFFPASGDVLSTVDHTARLARFCWPGVKAEDLPDTVSLTWVLPDGEQLIFPVQVR